MILQQIGVHANNRNNVLAVSLLLDGTDHEIEFHTDNTSADCSNLHLSSYLYPFVVANKPPSRSAPGIAANLAACAPN